MAGANPTAVPITAGSHPFVRVCDGQRVRALRGRAAHEHGRCDRRRQLDHLQVGQFFDSKGIDEAYLSSLFMATGTFRVRSTLLVNARPTLCSARH